MPIPAEIWTKIANYLPPNPLINLTLAAVCRSARSVFLCDTYWRVLDVYNDQSNIAARFVDRLWSYGRIQRIIILEGWIWLAKGHGKFDALSFCFPNDGSGYLKLDIRYQKIHYCHLLSANLDVRLIVTLKVLKELEIDYRVNDLFNHDESILMAPVDLTQKALMLPLCVYSARARMLCPPSLREDREFVLDILKYAGEFLGDGELLHDRDLALASVRFRGDILMDLENFQNDKEIVLEAISSAQGSASTVLSCASSDLQDDFMVVYRAVLLDGDALEHASVRLRDDTRIVATALSRDCHSIEFASERMRQSRDIRNMALRGGALLHEILDSSEMPCNDRELALKAVAGNSTNLLWLTPRLQQDPIVFGVAKANDFDRVLPEMGFK